MELLLLLVERKGELVTRDQIIEKLWGKDVFLDTDNGINTAIRKIRHALNDDAEQSRFVQTVPAKGYRFIAPVTPMDVEDAATQKASESESNENRSGLGRKRFRPLTVAAVAVSGMAVVWILTAIRSNTASSASTPVIRSLAVLPLENLTGDPSQDYFSDGMTDVLITDLAQISALRVVSRTSSMRFKGTPKPLSEIARELGVDGIVEGTVVRSAQRVRVTVQVIRASPEGHVWANQYDRPLGDVVELQAELAHAISQAIRITLTPREQSRLAGGRRPNREAFEVFLKGRYFWSRRTEETTKKAIEYFRQAIENDPNYAMAFVGLADAYKSLAMPDSMQEALPPREAFQKARAAVTRALAIDDTIAEAHASLAHIQYLYDRDWSSAENELRRAIELNPNYASAHQWYGYYLMWTGRLDEARNEIERAKELDPLSPTIDGTLGLILFSAHQNEQAIEQARKPLEIAPDSAFAHYRLGQIYVFTGSYREAIPELEKAIALSGGSSRATAELGFAYARSGRRAEALKLLDALNERSKQRYVSPLNLAIICAGLGERESTLYWLEKASEDRDPSLDSLKLSSAFAIVESEPRFTEIIRRVGLHR
jgi:TolB-like protein/Tfp pilus assembly protein PilF